MPFKYGVQEIQEGAVDLPRVNTLLIKIRFVLIIRLNTAAHKYKLLLFLQARSKRAALEVINMIETFTFNII